MKIEELLKCLQTAEKRKAKNAGNFRIARRFLTQNPPLCKKVGKIF
ncbi:hypothetical protein ANACOL_01693 [Anaerotruncus colihominis DSM 17241]|uniref:Uncharacterized protein n=1 Tax=Anaerotruncus colihominis DSM 17241 TaxID=445972 RepID=B0P9M5_9FIRM|nr:hypothetical protein ANACOL_01693 [Anaerotruncus colihominis DSM 17241]